MLLEIKQEDIDKATPRDIYCCVISQAYKRITGHPCWTGEKGIMDSRTQQYWKLDAEGQELINKFDSDKQINPTTITLSAA